jgi:Uma2 family endonuclease
MATVPQISAASGLMTLEEYIRRFDQEGPFEVINGAIVPKMPTVLGHNDLADNLVWALNSYIRPRNLGKVYAEAPFVLIYDSNWVSGSLVPDIMFVLQSRLTHYQENDPDWKNKPLVMAADLAIEIISPNDSYTEINAKVGRYLQDGVQLVWVIDPQRRTVTVHTQGSNQQTLLSGEDVLTGGAVLPSFEISLPEIFG